MAQGTGRLCLTAHGTRCVFALWRPRRSNLLTSLHSSVFHLLPPFTFLPVTCYPFPFTFYPSSVFASEARQSPYFSSFFRLLPFTFHLLPFTHHPSLRAKRGNLLTSLHSSVFHLSPFTFLPVTLVYIRLTIKRK